MFNRFFKDLGIWNWIWINITNWIVACPIVGMLDYKTKPYLPCTYHQHMRFSNIPLTTKLDSNIICYSQISDSCGNDYNNWARRTKIWAKNQQNFSSLLVFSKNMQFLASRQGITLESNWKYWKKVILGSLPFSYANFPWFMVLSPNW